MATKTIAWTSGTGNVTLTYGGQGNGHINVISDENNLCVERSMDVVVATTAGSPVRQVTVAITQEAGPNFRLSDGRALKLSDGKIFNVKTN